jgi:hypothetical protein
MKLVDGWSTSAIIGDGKAQRLLCPFCDVEYVHPIAVKVYPVQGVMEVNVNAKGLTTIYSDAAQHQDGVSIVLSFWCENGHHWDSELRFTHGLTSLETRLTGETEADQHGLFIEPLPDTIWRD